MLAGSVVSSFSSVIRALNDTAWFRPQKTKLCPPVPELSAFTAGSRLNLVGIEGNAALILLSEQISPFSCRKPWLRHTGGVGCVSEYKVLYAGGAQSLCNG